MNTAATGTAHPMGARYFEREELASFGFRSLGRDVKISTRASIYCPENIDLGDHVRIDDFSVIIATGPLQIGSYVSIPNFCALGSRNGITLADFVTFAPGVKIFSASDDYSGEHLTGVAVPAELTGGTAGPVHIGRHCIIGTGSAVLPALTIGEGCAIGAFSMVKGDLDPWGVYAGVPVRRIAERDRKLLDLAASIPEAMNKA